MNQAKNSKVGSDVEAAHHFAGKSDFGMTTQQAIDTAREEGIQDRPAGSAPGYSGSKGVRTTGVGGQGGEAGHDSGGDLDPDVIGFGGQSGLSAKPVTGHTDGPDDAPISTRRSTNSKIKPGTHGVAPSAQGDYVDHSGEDASTINPEQAGNVTPQNGVEPGAEGEISGAEASGNVEQGGEV
jgi:hypothetical protein